MVQAAKLSTSLTLALSQLWQQSQVWVRAGSWLPLAGAGRACSHGAFHCQGLAILLPPGWFTEEPLGSRGTQPLLPADLLHAEGCAGTWLLPGRRRERSERGRVWIGRREQVTNQLLEERAEVDLLLWWAAVPDRTCPMPRVGHHSFDSRACLGLLARPRNQSLLNWVFTWSVVVSSTALWSAISILLFTWTQALAVLGEFHLSKRWANLSSFKS